VWEVRRSHGEPQVLDLTLAEGANPARLSGPAGDYATVVPQQGASFSLERGRTYRLEIWGRAESPATATFAL